MLENYTREQSKFLHLSSIQFDAQYGITLTDFVGSIDPLRQFKLMKELSNPMALRSQREANELTQTLKNAKQEATAFSQAAAAAAIISQADGSRLRSDSSRH